MAFDTRKLYLIAVILLVFLPQLALGAHSDSNLILYYPMNSTSGSSVTDYSGTANDGFTNGGVTKAVSGVGGTYGFGFDGSDDYVEIDTLDPIEDSSTSDFTFSGWMKMEGSTGNVQQLFETPTDNGGEVYLETDGNTPFTMQFHITDDSGTDHMIDTSPQTFDVDEWHHFAATYDGSTQKLYVDGSQVASTSWSGTFTMTETAEKKVLGIDNDLTIQPFDGKFDEIRIYDRALTGAEVNHLYTNAVPGPFKMEVGKISISDTRDNGVVNTVNMKYDYQNPVVVAYIPTRNGGDSVDVRVDNVDASADTFDIFMEEPDNGGHSSETASYIVVEEGVHVMPDGTKLEAGRHTTSQVHASGSYNGDTISFSQSYSTPPVVLATLNTYNNGEFMSDAISEGSGSCNDLNCRPTTTQFGLEQDALETGHESGATSETLGWIAVQDVGVSDLKGVPFETGKGEDGDNDGVDNNGHTLSYSAGFSKVPIVTVDGQSGVGSNGYWARGYGTHTSSSHDTAATEDQIGDSERSHTNVYMGYWAFEEEYPSEKPPWPPINPSPPDDEPPALAPDPTSQTVEALIRDPNDDPIDQVTFYKTGFQSELKLAMWDHSETSGASNKQELDDRVDDGADVVSKFGQTSTPNIDCDASVSSCNPFSNDHTYGTCITGYIYAPRTSTYNFSVDSDDASDFYVNVDSTDMEYCDSVNAGKRVVEWYGDHAESNENWAAHSGSVRLAEGYHSIMLRHSDRGGADDFQLAWNESGSMSIVPDTSLFREDPSLRSQIGSVQASVTNDTRASTSDTFSCGTDHHWMAVADDGLNTMAGQVWTFNTTSCNDPPQAFDPDPPDAASGITGNPVPLSVKVTDTDDPTINVWFYNASDDTLIGSEMGVASGDRANADWYGLAPGNTYDWYVEASDGTVNTTTSPPWSFAKGTVSPVSCAPGWVPYDNHCYANTTSMSYSAAEAWCASNSAYITTVDDGPENTWLWNNFAQPGVATGIGLHDDDGNNIYQDNEWDGPDSSYRNWEAGYPQAPTNPSHDSVYYSSAEEWQDVDGSTNRKWICERSPVPGLRFDISFDFDYTSLTSDIDNPSIILIEVNSESFNIQNITLDLSGVNAEFLNGGGTTKNFDLNAQSTRRFQVRVEPATTGIHTLRVTGTNEDFDISETIEMPVNARDYPVTAAGEEAPGIGALQLLVIVMMATALYFSSL